mgnify:CR=1 FL=1
MLSGLASSKSSQSQAALPGRARFQNLKLEDVASKEDHKLEEDKDLSTLQMSDVRIAAS